VGRKPPKRVPFFFLLLSFSLSDPVQFTGRLDFAEIFEESESNSKKTQIKLRKSYSLSGNFRKSFHLWILLPGATTFISSDSCRKTFGSNITDEENGSRLRILTAGERFE
jgi:hypothetical protein